MVPCVPPPSRGDDEAPCAVVATAGSTCRLASSLARSASTLVGTGSCHDMSSRSAGRGAIARDSDATRDRNRSLARCAAAFSLSRAAATSAMGSVESASVAWLRGCGSGGAGMVPPPAPRAALLACEGGGGGWEGRLCVCLAATGASSSSLDESTAHSDVQGRSLGSSLVSHNDFHSPAGRARRSVRTSRRATSRRRWRFFFSLAAFCGSAAAASTAL